jgi:three-Cys-motif partner protein
MSHKADSSFFQQKRSWSERKDQILNNYLKPYLAKVNKLNKPILIVDAFAGQGRFDDGKPGSPLIICDNISKSNFSVDVEALFIEQDPELSKKLEMNVREFGFVSVKCGSFLDFIHEIEQKAESHTVFLYIDPYTVKGLHWDQMEKVFQCVRKSSVEVLMNFNAFAFGRWAMSCLSRQLPEPEESENIEELMEYSDKDPSKRRLNEIVGGDWWQDVFSKDIVFSEKLSKTVKKLCLRLEDSFSYARCHGLKAESHHTIPKYFLIFCSRHPDALILMNDQFVASQRKLAERAISNQPTLFEIRSHELIPDFEKLPYIILNHSQKPISRKDLYLKILNNNFGQFHKKEIRERIAQLLENGSLQSETGKTRINDEVKIWAV